MMKTPTIAQKRKKVGIVEPSIAGRLLLFFLPEEVVNSGSSKEVPVLVSLVWHDFPEMHKFLFPVTLISSRIIMLLLKIKKFKVVHKFIWSICAYHENNYIDESWETVDSH